MKILLLEDNENKRRQIESAALEFFPAAQITPVSNWYDYSRQVNAVVYDLILLDLMVPRSPRDPRVEDHHSQLMDTTRDFGSLCFRTPAIVLTEYLEQSEEYFRDLNKVDITVISFDSSGEWREALRLKMLAAEPKVAYDFVIVCALSKEMAAFEDAADGYGALKTISGLLCREVLIAGTKGVIVQASRMGLVAGAVTASLAIERFSPRLVCMSGICGGASADSKIYDLLISEVCHQHDSGKWSDEGFKSEHYDVQVEADVRNFLEELVADAAIRERISNNLRVKQSEYPEGIEEIYAKPKIVATSSGSAVIAEGGKTASLSVGQRKLAGFDMEVFSLYEAARLASKKPAFFAVKSVVDDGDRNKGDRFHRLGCLLSARFVAEAVKGWFVRVGH